MDGQKVKGKRIKVAYAKPRAPREGGDNGGGRGRGRGGFGGGNGGDRPKGCFKCGKEGHFAR